MRRIPESEIETDFERQYAWGDEERHFYNPNRRKASVMGFFLRLEHVVELVKKYVQGSRIADLASAQGTFALTLCEAGYDVTAVDINEDFLRYARKKHTHGKFQTVLSNIMDFRATEKFDAVLLGEIIEHVAFPDQLLVSAAANLKPGGILILTTPNGSEFNQPLPTYSEVKNIEELIPKQFHWGDHLFLYTEAELKSLFDRAGFDWIECLKLNSSYITQLKGARYLLPLFALRWLEKISRSWKKSGKDSTNCLIAVGRYRG